MDTGYGMAGSCAVDSGPSLQDLEMLVRVQLVYRCGRG